MREQAGQASLRWGLPGALHCQHFGTGRPSQPGRWPSGSQEGRNRSLQSYELRNSSSMGELIVLDSGLDVPALVSALVSLLALAIYALNQAGKENNDDDDSSPGGGLMQPTS
ncbi:MAG TPA: hypothetical protein DDY43_04415 [Synechococcales bacterium UBA10510]|nr:hypothetical protein [Synechococcales bacterium UBA10510]